MINHYQKLKNYLTDKNFQGPLSQLEKIKDDEIKVIRMYNFYFKNSLREKINTELKKILKEENDVATAGLRLKIQSDIFMYGFGGAENFSKIKDILTQNNINFSTKTLNIKKKPTVGLMINTDLSPKASSADQKYKNGVIELQSILNDYPNLKFDMVKSPI